MATPKVESRRKQTIKTIRALTREHRQPPTVRELAVAMGGAVSTTHKDLVVLREQGLIEWHPGQPRTMKVVRKTA